MIDANVLFFPPLVHDQGNGRRGSGYGQVPCREGWTVRRLE